MARPSLEEIFATQPQEDQRPSLDQIFSQPAESYQAPQYDDPPQQRPSLNEIFGQPAQPQPEQEQNGIMNVLGNVWDAVKEPASAALEGLSYLDKPRGALAGATVALQNDAPVLEGLQKGWNENTSWKETFNPEWVKENPKTAAVTGFAADVALDPLWFVTPAKIAKSVSEGSKAIGLTDNIINPAVNAVRGTEAGQKAIALTEDIAGKSRVADEAFDFNAGRATDQLGADDLVDSVRNLKSQYGEDANKLTDYIEASPKPNNVLVEPWKMSDEAFSTATKPTKLDTRTIPKEEMTPKQRFFNEFENETSIATRFKTPTELANRELLSGAETGKAINLTGFRQEASTASRIPNTGTFYASDPALASIYGLQRGTVKNLTGSSLLSGGSKKTLTVDNLSLKNPLVIDGGHKELVESLNKLPFDNNFKTAIAKLWTVNGEGKYIQLDKVIAQAAKKSGHDGIIYRNGDEAEIVSLISGAQKENKYGNKLVDSVLHSDKQRLIDQQVSNNVIKSLKSGELVQKIANGEIQRSQAFNALRDAGEEIPDYLLQNTQRVAKETSQAIPNTVTRDSVLKAIPDPGLRKAIETIGEQFITRNKANADALRATGRLSDEAYVSYLDGEHLRRSYEQYETPDKFLEALRKNGTDEEYRRVYQALNKSKAPGGQGYGAVHKVDTKDFIQRQTLSDDTMKKLGLIKDPEYRIMDTLNRSSKTLREDEYLNRINTVWGKTGDEAADLSRTLPKRRQYMPIPESKAYGALAGKWVPKDIHDQVIKLTGTGASSSELVQGWQKAVSWFKVAKLANPASTMRNFYSGIPMANVFGGLPMQSMPKYMAKATQALRGGNKNPLMREVKETGILGNVWQKQDLKNIIGDNPSGIKKLAEKGMNAFGKPDEFWRVATYAYHRDQGKSIKEAAQIANKALFDYSNAPEWVNTLSRTGAMPFAKFPYFATKATLKAAYENPAQLTKFTKAQNQANNEDREKILPDYLKPQTLLPLGEGTRMVNGKPQKVQNNLDLSYILPFASDIKFGNPVLDAIVMSRTGQNGLGQQVIKPGMTTGEQTKEWANWAYNALGPSFPLPGNYAGDKLSNAIQGRVDSKGRQYDLPSAAAQTLLGLKNVPINEQELYNQKITALTSEQRNIKAVMNQIAKDRSISTEQKKERLKDHQSQLKELGKELQETSKAWQRQKKRADN